MRNEIVRELLSEYEQQRMRNAEEESRRREIAVATVPEIGRLLAEREALIMGSVRGILDGRAGAGDLPAQMDALNRRITSLLVGQGMDAEWLSPVYRCRMCRDTGYVGEPVREMCDCMRQRLFSRLYREVGLEEQTPQTFETFDDQIFSAEPLPGRAYSQRSVMNRIRAAAEGWADKYPAVAQKTVLLQGKSGLGKTFLMHAMARRLLDRGLNVLVISAYRYLDIARKAYFSGKTDDLDALMEADVLMVDDLGSEPLMENITVIQWFNLINERQTRGKATVFSTNLGEKELRDQYTERIASRLLDKRTSLQLMFVGDDVRRM